MKRLSAIMALAAVALMADGASAAKISHRTAIHAQAPRTALQARPYNRLEHPYESDSLGHQWFINPDRVSIPGQFP